MSDDTENLASLPAAADFVLKTANEMEARRIAMEMEKHLVGADNATVVVALALLVKKAAVSTGFEHAAEVFPLIVVEIAINRLRKVTPS